MSATDDFIDMRTGRQWMDLIDAGSRMLRPYGWESDESFMTTFITLDEYNARIVESKVMMTVEYIKRIKSL